MCGPLHLFFANLCVDSVNPVVEFDNAHGHATPSETKPNSEPPLRRSNSTGSLGLRKNNRPTRKGGRRSCRWESGTPKVLESLSNDDDSLLTRSKASPDIIKFDLDDSNSSRRSRRSSGSSVGSDDSSCRWGSSCVKKDKKDGAVKLPRRKRANSGTMEEPKSYLQEDVFIALEEVDTPLCSSKHNASLDSGFPSPAEIFRVC